MTARLEIPREIEIAEGVMTPAETATPAQFRAARELMSKRLDCLNRLLAKARKVREDLAMLAQIFPR